MGWNADIDWTSPATLINSPTSAIRDIYLAYTERQKAVRSFVIPSALSARLNNPRVLVQLDENGLRKIASRAYSGVFVNMDGNAIEDFDGDTALPSAWSIADLETAIGDLAPEEYNYPDGLGAAGPTAYWLWWWHEALNLMTVIKREPNSVDTNYREGSGSSWSNCLSSFAADSWTTDTNYGSFYHRAFEHGGTFYARRNRLQVRANQNSAVYFMPDARYVGKFYEYAWYLNLEKAPGFVGNTTYENPEFPTSVEDKYALVASQLTPIVTDASGRLQSTISLGDITTVTVSQPASGKQRGYTATDNGGVVLMDMAVAGGFEYVP